MIDDKFDKCHCDSPGFCPLFNKVMTDNPPNWQWCQNCSKNERKAYYDKLLIHKYDKGRIGIVSICYNQIGGTETYWKMLSKYIKISGVAVDGIQINNNTDIHIPIYYGKHAIFELANVVNYLIIWGIKDLNYKQLTDGPKRIAIHHGCLSSEWDNLIFENQLKWCEYGVAINKEVATYYKVKHIENTVDISRIYGQPYKKNKKIVLWIHRNSKEKRPLLAKEIAKNLPRDWLMVATLPAEMQIDNKLLCIGNINHPGNWLQTADVFLSTADKEGFGYSVAEALMANLPVVTAPVGIGLNNSLCWQVNSTNPKDWIKTIITAQENYKDKKQSINRWKLSNTVDIWKNNWENFLSSL